MILNMTGDKITKKRPRKATKGNFHNNPAEVAKNALENKKGVDVKILPLENGSSIADALIIATGTSEIHVQALAEEVEKDLKCAGFGIIGVEGTPENQWVLVDAFDVVVHIFLEETRELYNLEKLWGHEQSIFDDDEEEDISNNRTA